MKRGQLQLQCWHHLSNLCSPFFGVEFVPCSLHLEGLIDQMNNHTFIKQIDGRKVTEKKILNESGKTSKKVKVTV